MEHDHFITLLLQIFACLIDARRRQPEHRRRDERSFLYGMLHLELQHTGYRQGRVRKYFGRNRVQSRHVDDRWIHHNIARPDILRDIPGSDGRHHNLRHADWERSHSGRNDRCAAAAAEGEDSIEFTFRVQSRISFSMPFASTSVANDRSRLEAISRISAPASSLLPHSRHPGRTTARTPRYEW